MSKKPDEKLAIKRQVLVQRTALALGVPEAEATTLLQIRRQQSLRINTLRAPAAKTLAELVALDWSGSKYGWAVNGYTLDCPLESIHDSMAVAEGWIFIQNAASWLPVIALDPRPGDVILDVCAAPGGKTSHIAAITRNQAQITANDNSRPRLAKMRANFERLGVLKVETTLYDAAQIARKLDGQQFDKILLDAPCSGEGMMQLDRDKDFASWSVAHIKRLQQLQKRILTQSWQLLKPGGTLVYSTCTMAPEENEAVIDYLLRSQENATIEPLTLEIPNRVPTVTEWNGKRYNEAVKQCMRLKPSKNIEAFFVCKLKKIA